MKLDKLVGERFKDRPTDCVIDSHAVMVRGGYIKQVTSGVFSSYNVLRRIERKVEEIIRQEMDAVDGQEVKFPVTMPASLWEESGRYFSVNLELLRFQDRNGSPMVLGMTHEEACVHLVRDYGQTYMKYPFRVYQIQTKFRDEARPRAGLIRVREFSMKDAYSFHTSQEDLNQYYDRCLEAYHRVFSRCGIPETVAVIADSGMMGGSVSHEFMLLTPAGEDSVVICRDCDYHANMEAAECIVKNDANETPEPLMEVYTPGFKTIDDVCGFLKAPVEKSVKAVVYQKTSDDSLIVVFIRGDLEINETKLKNLIREEITPAVITPGSGLAAGYIGPHGLTGKFAVYYDNSLKGAVNFVCGANRDEFHYTGFSMERDAVNAEYYDLAEAVEGGVCPKCGKQTITISRGIEVGNIFQLGTKYTKSMNMLYTDQNGEQHHPIMGCYGIGIGRLIASVCEVNHDDYGPIWPMAIAPWQVHLCCVRADDAEAKAQADAIYKQLQDRGIEVIYDDRVVSAGFMFSDADLLGVPIRIVVSPRNLKNNCVEIITRDKKITKTVKPEDAVKAVSEMME
jgi:prolyl-tRNA synthetase